MKEDTPIPPFNSIPAMILVIGVLIGSIIGVLIRTNNWLGENDWFGKYGDEKANVARWQSMGIDVSEQKNLNEAVQKEIEWWARQRLGFNEGEDNFLLEEEKKE